MGLGVVVMVGLLAALVAALQLPVIATPVVRRLLTLAPLNPGHRLEVARVSGNFLRGLTLEDVRLSFEGRELARIRRLQVRYHLPHLRPPATTLDELTVDGAVIAARRHRGEWDLLHVLRESADSGGGAGMEIRRVRLRDVTAAAAFAPDSVARGRIDRLDARGLLLGAAPRLELDTLRAGIQPPGTDRWLGITTRGRLTADEFRLDALRIHTEASTLTGSMVLPRDFRQPRLVDRLDVRLAASPLDLADLAAFVPSVPAQGRLRFNARAEGDGDLVTAHLAASLDSARLTLDGGTRLRHGAPASYRLRGAWSGLDPSRLSRAAPAGDLSGRLDADIEGPLANADGRARLRLDRSIIGSVLVRHLEIGARFDRGTAQLTLGGALDSGSVTAEGRARPFDSIPTYRLRATATGLPGTGGVARALAGGEAHPRLVVGVRLAGSGTSPASATASGRVDFSVARDTGATLDLGHAPFRLAAGRLAVQPDLRPARGRVTARAEVTFGDTVTYGLREGRLERVDPGWLSGDTTLAPVSGRFRLSGRGAARDEASITAHLQLDELRVGERRIERVALAARLDRGRLRLDGRADAGDGRVTLEASGRPFDSTATYVLHRAGLDAVDLGRWLGRPDWAGPVSLSFTGDARVRGPHRSAAGLLTLDSSRVGRIDVEGGRVALRLADERVTYDASLETGAGAISLAGDGVAGADLPVYRVREGRLTAIDLGVLLGRPGLETDLNTTFTADLAGRSPDSLRGTLNLSLLPSRVNRAELTGGALAARVSGRGAEATLRAEGPDLAVDASLRSEPIAGGSAITTDGAVRVEQLARWTGRVDLDGRLESRFAVNLETDSAGLRSAGGTVDATGGVGGVRVPTVHLAMTPAPGRLRLDTVIVRSNLAVLDGGGSLQLRPGAQAPDTLALRGTLADLAPVAGFLGRDTVSFDSARVSLVATGPAWRWRLDGMADARGLAYGANLANHATLGAVATLDSTRLSAVTGKLRLEAAAVGPLNLRELSAAGAYDSTVALDLDLTLSDSVQVATRIRGSVSAARDTVRAELQKLTLREGGRDWALERPAALVFGPRMEVGALVLGAGDRSISLNGVLDRRGTSDLELRVSGLDLEALRAAGLVPIGGRLDGDLHLTGPARTPRLEGRIDLAIVSPGDGELGTLGTDLAWTADGLRVAAAATPRRGGALTVEGTLPYRLRLVPRDTAGTPLDAPLEGDTVSLAIRADSFDLALFQPLLPEKAATGLQGRLQADARIRGAMRAAQATGTVRLSQAALELPAIGVDYERGSLDGRLEADAFRIERLRLFTGKDEELSATGSVRLSPLDDPALDLDAVLRHFRLVHSDQLQTAASGRLAVAGTLRRPEVSGTLELDRTNFFVGGAAAQSRVESVELTPAQLRDLARDFGPSVLSRGAEAPGLVDRTRLDLAIRMPGQVWIRRARNPRTDLELTGSLRLTQLPGEEMRFFGQVEPTPGRGTLEFNGRQFRVTDGDITLAGPVDSTKLDVTATYNVPTQGTGDDEGVLISVRATGRLDSLGLEFTSDPAMGQDDILSYVVTGRPTSDNPLFEGQGGGSTGERMALGTLTGAISNTAGQGLGFDVFQIRQEPTRGLTLTAGRYVGARLFLNLQLPLQLGSQSRQASGSNLGPGFELEYTMRRWLRANLQGGSLPPGLMFRARRAY